MGPVRLLPALLLSHFWCSQEIPEPLSNSNLPVHYLSTVEIPSYNQEI
jgi:hypothetical protein